MNFRHHKFAGPHSCEDVMALTRLARLCAATRIPEELETGFQAALRLF